ncbi:MAG TPA: hypothetical protein VJ743_16605 [Albitalea sp.]|nr:hypothetical protein [Albitalea sp.]
MSKAFRSAVEAFFAWLAEPTGPLDGPMTPEEMDEACDRNP